jgi:hypothetical protein
MGALMGRKRKVAYIPVITEGEKLSPKMKRWLITRAERGNKLRHTEDQIRANFTESIEDAEEVLKRPDAPLDERLMAYGAGLLMIKKCREWHLLRENELDVMENRLHRLMNEA